MFDREITRVWLGIGWLLGFMALWAVFQYYLLPNKALISELDGLEKSIVEKNWASASNHIKNIERLWKESKLNIQMNNGTTEVDDFEEALAEASILVKHREDDALVYVGSMRDIGLSITKAFPGP